MEEEKKDLGKQAADALRGLFHEFREGLDDLQLPTLVDMAAESGVARLQYLQLIYQQNYQEDF